MLRPPLMSCRRFHVLAPLLGAALALSGASLETARDAGNAFAAAPTKPRKSVTIGNMDDLACNKELKKLKIPHVRAPGAAKIDQPIIVTGAINGVHFDTGRPYKQRTIATGDAID